MNIEQIIETKRDKKRLSREQIHFFIKNYVDGNIPDYQASSLLMAIYLNGMNDEETSILTDEMRNSGEVWNLDSIPGVIVDKHSTGGVGDKVSLILGPMVASLGAKVAKMSGRGLGHTGGTLDKLESIPGFQIERTYDQFVKQIGEIGLSIIGQNKNLVPADKKLYALRDVTGTVGSIPLIASSIMSKKLASGADAILLDVKYGSGAFMKTKQSAIKLASLMVGIGKKLNKDVRAEVTNMDQPLGNAIGNSLEVIEVINTLRGNGPRDLVEICTSSGAIMLLQAKIYHDYEEAFNELSKTLIDGRAFNKFFEFVEHQGGNTHYIMNPAKFELAKNQINIYSTKAGYIKKIDALTIGIASMRLGAGREKIDDEIDMSAGIILNKKIGDTVEKGELLATLHTNKDNVNEIKNEVLRAFSVSKKVVDPINYLNRDIIK